jgi:hypothetical protein
MVKYPEGAITTLEEFKAEALIRPKLYVAPCMYDPVTKFGSKGPIVGAIEFSGQVSLGEKDLYLHFAKGAGASLWAWREVPTVIPFTHDYLGYIFTHYWMAYGHLQRVLQQRKENGNP